jgi:hypothetical protein
MGLIRRGIGILAVLGLVLLAFAAGWVAGWLRLGTAVDAASLSDAERRFSESLRDVALVGTFTVDGQDRTPREDRYEISSVEKVGDNLWRFNASMQCCGVNGEIPIVIPVQFAGDLPVIMMTDTNIPGVGTFTVRLFFSGDRYAGTWQHGAVGGHMSGRIEKRTTS